jgi:hypothetical protein
MAEARMIAANRLEAARAELVEALVGMVSHLSAYSKAEAQAALDDLKMFRAIVAKLDLDDLRDDLDAAERTIRAYLSM